MSRPRLAVGSHPAGSGKGCLMNIISWGNGDVKITDMPTCTHPVLARAAIALNDRVCTHRDGDLLCVDCSTIMFGYEPLLVGSAPPEDPLEAKRLAVTLAVSLRPHVEPSWRPEDAEACSAAFAAAQAWLDCPCKTHTDAAYTYAYTAAAASAFFAAFVASAYAASAAASDAASAAFFAASASAAAYAVTDTAAAYAACAADAAASAAAYAFSAASAYAASAAASAVSAAFFAGTTDPRVVLDTLIDVYYTHTGRPRPAPDPQRLNRALAAAGLA